MLTETILLVVRLVTAPAPSKNSRLPKPGTPPNPVGGRRPVQVGSATRRTRLRCPVGGSERQGIGLRCAGALSVWLSRQRVGDAGRELVGLKNTMVPAALLVGNAAVEVGPHVGIVIAERSHFRGLPVGDVEE